MAVDQRKFGNVLDINGTEVNVEDKRLAELAGQTPKSSSQISTSSQYVPLQDTDGNIVKISPASFQEAVRNTLASLLVNNDKGTSFSQVPVIGSGDFGSASLANLASVLGADGVRNLTPFSQDIDTLLTPGCYTIGGNSPHMPEMYAAIVVVKSMVTTGEQVSDELSQTLYYRTGHIYYRTRHSGTWGSWIRPDVWGYSTLADLASALGDSKMKSLMNNSSSTIHRKLVFSNYENYKSYATIYYSRFGSSTAIYNVFRTLNSAWLITPIVENPQQPLTDINDIVIDSYSSLTVTAFNCDVSIDPIS